MDIIPLQDTSFVFEEIDVIRARVISATPDFLNKSIHKPGASDKTMYWGRDELIQKGFFLDVFPNGRGEEDKGFVSLSLVNMSDHCYETMCTVSIIDVCKKEQWTGSFTLSLPLFKNNYLEFNKYVSRKMFNKHGDDLLPDGALTLKIDFELKLMDNFNFEDESLCLMKGFENILMMLARVTSRTRDFLNAHLHQSGERGNTEYFGRDVLIAKGYVVDIFPNGITDKEKGFVSLSLRKITTNLRFEGYCTVSVIDASKKERYKRTFILSFPTITDNIFQIDKYISREQLISDRADLLPADELTLRIDLLLIDYFSQQNEKNVVQFTITTRTLLEPTHLKTPESFSKDKTEYSGQVDLLKFGINLQVCVEENTVFLLFHTIRKQDGSFIVSVMDAFGSQRLSRTFTISYDMPPNTYKWKYISRERLTSNFDENSLLSGNILTLKIEASLMLRTLNTFPGDMTEIYSNFRKFESYWGLLLDSPLTKRLAEESDYFSALLQTPMIENKTKVMPLVENEFSCFTHIAQLLIMPGSLTEFYSVKQILNLYILADKYHIPLVSETCVCFLKLYASVHTMEELFKDFETYGDGPFNEIIKKLFNLIRDTNFTEEIYLIDSDLIALKIPIRQCFWVYIKSECDRKITFSDMSTERSYYIENLMKDENKYDFYK